MQDARLMRDYRMGQREAEERQARSVGGWSNMRGATGLVEDTARLAYPTQKKS